jgi:glycosyltransferase involved in cell wall biosynthesis
MGENPMHGLEAPASSREDTKDTAWPVMVLAHNEAENIVGCLDSIYAADPGHAFSIFVMANGCTDDTERIVSEYAETHDGVELVSIAMADRCNAWNVFIHETMPAHVPGRSVYFFMDGDCRACPGSFSELAKGLEENPRANAAGAPPACGRSREKDARELLEGHRIVANLYALSGRFVRDIQAKAVRLPLGLDAADDGMIGALAKCDLDPRREWDDALIVPCPKAGFLFDSLSPTNLKHYRQYWRRLVLYGRRHYDNQLLGPKLKKDGIAGMPERISDLYVDAKNLRLRWQGIFTIPNFVALKRIQKKARQTGQVHSARRA